MVRCYAKEDYMTEMTLDECKAIRENIAVKIALINEKYKCKRTIDRSLIKELHRYCYDMKKSLRGKFWNVGEQVSRLADAAGKLAKNNSDTSNISDLYLNLSRMDVAISVHQTYADGR
jgi:hypothetical protein